MTRLLAILILFGFFLPCSYGEETMLDDGSSYKGQLEDGKYHGQGTLTFPDGRKYVGEFRNDRYHGQGTMNWIDGTKYVGEWKDHHANGQGTLTFPDGRKYVGEFRNDKMHGQGIFTLVDEVKYEGEFKNDKLWNVQQFDKNGKVIGVWEKGVFRSILERIRDGTAFVVSKDYLLTALHVLKDCINLRISQSNEETNVELVSSSKKYDLGLLKSEKSFRHIAKFRSGDPIRKGDTIVIYGYPLLGDLADGGQPSKGEINALAGWKNKSSDLQYDAATHDGNSGGPVLDLSGNIVGIVQSRSPRYGNQPENIAHNVNFAVKSEFAEEFLSNSGVDFEKVESNDEMKTADIAEMADKFTVSLECWGIRPL